MLKWAVGQRNPTPGHLSSCYNCTSTEESSGGSFLHVARPRNSRAAVRRASIRSLTRIKQDKENQPCATPKRAPLRIRDSLKFDLMSVALRDVSNSPDTYSGTPKRHDTKRRQSHPLNAATKKPVYRPSKSAPANTAEFLDRFRNSAVKRLPQLEYTTASHKTPRKRKSSQRLFGRSENSSNEDIDTVDMRRPSSTLKTLSTMQIEYSPGPLTATQSLMSLRQRLTGSLSRGVHQDQANSLDNPLYYALNSTEKTGGLGITINCNEQSPTLEGLLEEKSLHGLSDKTQFINIFKKDNSRLENSLVSTLSERLEWLRLNNARSVLQETFLSVKNQGVDDNVYREKNDFSSEESIVKKRQDCDILKRQKCVVRRKIRRNGAAGIGMTSCCDKPIPKIEKKPQLMGLTLPIGELLVFKCSPEAVQGDNIGKKANKYFLEGKSNLLLARKEERR